MVRLWLWQEWSQWGDQVTLRTDILCSTPAFFNVCIWLNLPTSTSAFLFHQSTCTAWRQRRPRKWPRCQVKHWLRSRVQMVDSIGGSYSDGSNFNSPGGVMWVIGVCTGRDSPPGNEASEEAEEPMAIPEDLSASSAHQQNNRSEKGTRLRHTKRTPASHHHCKNK